ncbi:type I restriction-modification system subunit M N-terminal domain-containing protein [Pseudarthrobacter sp. H2]|uniref:type I restriction-modification system subunit M N-terminal domain-containing protein n=1 Tax=Pseudarthrobacter sp. H2 TaxID=3418415 RepID=UPI003CF0EC26
MKSQVDKVWNTFWSGGISNPLEIIEQITYLLFLKRLDERHTLQEKKANLLASRWRTPSSRPAMIRRADRLQRLELSEDAAPFEILGHSFGKRVADTYEFL